MLDETKIFVIEGVDGCGKTTICKALSKKNRWKYIKTPTGIFREHNYKMEKLGDKPLAFSYFLTAVLYTSYLHKKNIKHGNHIICDRYYPTLKVYYAAMNYLPDFVNLENIPIIKPNKTVHLYVDYKVIQERLKMKMNISMDEIQLLKSRVFYDQLVEGYRKECDVELDATSLSVTEIVEKLNTILNA